MFIHWKFLLITTHLFSFLLLLHKIPNGIDLFFSFFNSLKWREKVECIICCSLHLKRKLCVRISINTRLGCLLRGTFWFCATCCIFNRWHFSARSNMHLAVQQSPRWFRCSSDRSEIMFMSLPGVIYNVSSLSLSAFSFLVSLSYDEQNNRF